MLLWTQKRRFRNWYNIAIPQVKSTKKELQKLLTKIEIKIFSNFIKLKQFSNVLIDFWRLLRREAQTLLLLTNKTGSLCLNLTFLIRNLHVVVLFIKKVVKLEKFGEVIKGDNTQPFTFHPQNNKNAFKTKQITSWHSRAMSWKELFIVVSCNFQNLRGLRRCWWT